VGSAAQYFEVEAPVEQVYAYWRDFSHFPAFMPDVEEVIVTGPTTSHWKVTGPLGKSVEWDAEIVEDVPNQRIAWRSVGDADVDNAGAVRFDDRGGRTNIEVSLTYDPPGGKAGELVAELVKDPDKQVQRGGRELPPGGGGRRPQPCLIGAEVQPRAWVRGRSPDAAGRPHGQPHPR
jgi:uncharacterized membrane protein